MDNLNDSTPWRNFLWSELACKCGQCDAASGRQVSSVLMNQVQILRNRCGFPFEITSAFRCPNHPTEAKKRQPGTHGLGLAVDIQVSGEQAYHLLREAMQMPEAFSGVGVQQKGDHGRRFIHLDIAVDNNRPWIWSY